MVPLVSVIIPTIRRGNLLCDALESVFRQTLGDWEIIVVNDGGGPAEGRVTELLSEPRVRYLEHPTPQGPSAARNTGIAASRGGFIAYLDDDDVYYPDHLEVVAGALERNGWDVTYADACKGIYEATGEGWRLLRKEPLDSVEFDARRLWSKNYIPILSLIHRRSCLDAAGGFDASLRYLEDWDLWLRLSRRFTFHHVPRVTTEYRFRIDPACQTRIGGEEAWWEASARIYLKHLGDPALSADPAREAILRAAVSRFVRRKYGWFAAKLDHDAHACAYRTILRNLSLRERINLFLRHPKSLVRAWAGMERT